MKNGQGRAILSVPFERSDFHEPAHSSIIERRTRALETAILFRRFQAGRRAADTQMKAIPFRRLPKPAGGVIRRS
jgi:hypothetical protein